MAVSSDTHTRKRPYQPSITSYFHTHSNGSSQALRPSPPLSSPLPGEIQSSLLSVGMRVRKSVPEGYKTHKTLGSAGFPFPSTAPAAQQPATPRSSYTSSGRELTPFCGLHKTGGWAAQEVPSSSAPAIMTSEMDVPGLSFSQASFGSTQDSFASARSVDCGSRKRTYEEEAEEEIDAFFDEIAAEEAMERRMTNDDRPIARMKARAGQAKVEMGGPVRVFGVDDFNDDFEEAAFLAPMDVDVA